MKKSTFILIIIMFFLCNASQLLASFDNVQDKNEFSYVTFEQFVQSLESKFRVKIDFHGVFDGQNLLMKSGDFSLSDSLAQFFEINNIKNSSFILNKKDKVAKIWILEDREDIKSNSILESVGEKKGFQVKEENLQTKRLISMKGIAVVMYILLLTPGLNSPRKRSNRWKKNVLFTKILRITPGLNSPRKRSGRWKKNVLFTKNKVLIDFV